MDCRPWIVDALGNPLDFGLTGASATKSRKHPLLAGRHCDYVIADKGYDASRVLEEIEARGAIPVIPARKGWQTPRGNARSNTRPK